MLFIQNMKIYYICTYLIFIDLRGWISPNNVQNQNLYISILFVFSLNSHHISHRTRAAQCPPGKTPKITINHHLQLQIPTLTYSVAIQIFFHRFYLFGGEYVFYMFNYRKIVLYRYIISRCFLFFYFIFNK